MERVKLPVFLALLFVASFLFSESTFEERDRDVTPGSCDFGPIVVRNVRGNNAAIDVRPIVETAQRTIDVAAGWTGLKLFDETSRRPNIAFDWMADDLNLVCFRFDTDSIETNRAADADTIAHETGHAIIHRLKPGWTSGVSLVLHEALSDAIAVFSNLGTRESAARVVTETGGDLRLENTASGIVRLSDGSYLRTPITNETLSDVRFSPDESKLPAAAVRGSRHDPHTSSVVLTAGLYDLFLLRLTENVQTGADLVNAIVEAANAIGELMLAARGHTASLS